MTKAAALVDRFWAKVDKKSPEHCWLWTARRSSKGYGYFRVAFPRRTMLLAHRVSWELHSGPVPDGLCVLHRCDNPPCVNPAHLFLGTHADNAADMVRKGRQSKGPGLLGEQQWSSKLTAETVATIRAASKGPNGYTKSEREALSRAHGVSPVTVAKVLYRQSWKHV